MTDKFCRACRAVPVPPRTFFCEPCRLQRAAETSKRYRNGMKLAPGEVSVSRQVAMVSLGTVARVLKVTPSRVQQIERMALLKLRRALTPMLDENKARVIAARETPEQRWMARTVRKGPVSTDQRLLMSQMEQLAEEYHADGQTETAEELRGAVRELQNRLESVGRGRSTAGIELAP